jgi:undecaprenyl diphosphate synthase
MLAPKFGLLSVTKAEHRTLLDERLADLRSSRLPRHVGVIPDGNRRWAVGHDLDKKSGYAHGIDPAFELYEACRFLGIEEVSFYGYTQENTKRPREQREAYQAACELGVERLRALDAELLIVGDDASSMFPEVFQPYTVRTRFGRGGLKVNLLINYSWRWDIDRLRSTGRLGSHDVSSVDLVVRWGGRTRLSGFLPIQCAYADIYVLEGLWPDYSGTDLVEALEWYGAQEVTKGG